MEIQINKEIRDYKETFAMGFSLRQLVYIVLTVLAAIVTYRLCIDDFGLELTSWICLLAAAPFAMLGFLKYEGMRAGEAVMVWLRYQLTPKKLSYQADNAFYDLLRDTIATPKKDKKNKEAEEDEQS